MSSALTAAGKRYADRIPVCGAKIAPDLSAHDMNKADLFFHKGNKEVTLDIGRLTERDNERRNVFEKNRLIING
jgi:hypothetical protein